MQQVLAARRQVGAALARGIAAGGVPWYRAGGTIPLANVLEAVLSPSIGQLYVGASVAAGNPYTVAIRTVDRVNDRWLFDSLSGRLVFGYYTGLFLAAGGPFSIPGVVLAAEDHVYMVVSDGANVTSYRDTTSFTPVASNVGIGSTTRWRSKYSGAGTGYDWTPACPCAAVYNIALNGTQLAALVAAMKAV